MPVIDLGSVVGPQGPQGVPGQTGQQGVQGNPGPNQVTGSTSTTLNGILQGNGSVVQAVASDAAPVSGSNNVVRSGAVFSALQKKVNPNLLINWYFAGGGTGFGVMPVNQRGQASYSSSGPNVDSWENDNSHTVVTLNSGYIKLQSDSVSYSGILQQRCPISPAVLLGNTVTFSMVYRGRVRMNVSLGTTVRSGYYASDTWAIASWTMTMPATASTDYMTFWLNIDGGAEVSYADIVAVKAEFGAMQTLATVDNGSVIVNEPIEYEKELLRSQLNWAASQYANDDLAGLGMATLAMIAPVVNGDKPSSAISNGAYFCWRGLLYKATAAISTSTSIQPGTNCTQTTIAANL